LYFIRCYVNNKGEGILLKGENMKIFIKPIILSSLILTTAFFIIFGAGINNSPKNKTVISEEYPYTLTEYESSIAIIDSKTNTP